MSLSQANIDMLKGAEASGLTLAQTIAVAESMLRVEGLRIKYHNSANNIEQDFTPISIEHREAIEALSTDEEKIIFILQKAVEMELNLLNS